MRPRRRTEKALLSVVQEAYVHGVSTRKVDGFVRALGIEGISRSEVSRICAALGERMEAFRNRPVRGEYPYVGLAATVVEVREGSRVHFTRNLLGLVPRGAQELVGAWVRTIFAQPDQEVAREQLELVVGSLEGKYPKAADLLREAGEDVITPMAFPQAHGRRIGSTNVLERLHRGVKRRCNVGGSSRTHGRRYG